MPLPKSIALNRVFSGALPEASSDALQLMMPSSALFPAGPRAIKVMHSPLSTACT